MFLETNVLKKIVQSDSSEPDTIHYNPVANARACHYSATVEGPPNKDHLHPHYFKNILGLFPGSP